jgi:adenylate cyclase
MLVSLCGRRRVEKIRHKVSYGETAWIVDVYEGKLTGITLAEIELPNEAQDFEKPDWVGREVTDDPRFGKRALFRLCADAGRPLTIDELLALPP